MPAGITEQLINTATVTLPPDVSDPVPDDNSATDANPANRRRI